jgi:hypothetical protein
MVAITMCLSYVWLTEKTPEFLNVYLVVTNTSS